LKGLAAAGFIRPTVHAEDDPRRTPYEITSAGRAAFDQWFVSLDGIATGSGDDIASRALFVFELPPEVVSDFFTSVEDVLSAWWKRLEYERERTLSRPDINERDRSVQSLLLARNLERTSADLTWLREARATYQRLRNEPQPVGPIASALPRKRTSGRARR
jgi:DNA-binding PadR family transcriptional regulator